MGSHPCLVLVEWELLQIPPGWPVTEQTESCLFSGSVTKGKSDTSHINFQRKKINKNCNNYESFVFAPLRSADAEKRNVMPT